MLDFANGVAGQAFTEYTCKLCGQKYVHHTTAVPQVCDNCSKKFHVCTDCGKSIIDNT